MSFLNWQSVASLLLLLIGCQGEHSHGHDHHQHAHGHGVSMIRQTLWGDSFELLVEHPVAVVKQPVSMLFRVTQLQDFQAVSTAKISLEWTGPETLKTQTLKAVTSGVFQVEVNPKKVGLYRGTVVLQGVVEETITGLELAVYPQAGDAPHQAHQEGTIELLKEQQWKVPFNTAFAEQGEVMATEVVVGRIQAPPNGMAMIGVPVTGRIAAPTEGIPLPGSQVGKGQTLATLLPMPASPETASQSNLAMAAAKARLAAAQTAVARAERLFRDEAISLREFEDAKRERQVAKESVVAAQRSSALYSGAKRGIGTSSWKLTSPIDGLLVQVKAIPGATATPGETLFQVVDTSELWIVAQVPEPSVGNLQAEQNAAFKQVGSEHWLPIDITSQQAAAKLVSVGRFVHATSRTIDVIYSLSSPAADLRIGGLVQVSLPMSKPYSGVVIPRSAVIDQDGRQVVYVQVDGEHFREQGIRVGPRSADKVAVLDGLKVGDRIVTRGAHVVRLAEKAGGDMSHGHVH